MNHGIGENSRSVARSIPDVDMNPRGTADKLARSTLCKGTPMVKALGIAVLLALAGCAGTSIPASVAASSPCQVHEASWACQVERYQAVNAP